MPLISSPYFEFLIVGLLSSTHCLIMCGGIVGALTVSLPLQTRQNPQRLFIFLAIYSLGRLLSYALAGFLAGLFGEFLVNTFSLQESHARILFTFSTLILVGIGLHIAGWLPAFARLEKIGSRLWRSIEPVAQSFLPATTRPQALVLGFLWGWLPCGVTYSVLIWSALLGTALSGSLAMISFGLGTVPGILLASYFSGRFYRFQKKKLKRGLGILIILLAVTFGFMWSPHTARHQDHPGKSGVLEPEKHFHNKELHNVVK
ncbi:MAG: sulfite exporter TauE/SafE family protein [Magnetococcales bacterium]|nr:sulfite exporter TauE/SafE family protein [Magnetococcales bacterium]